MTEITEVMGAISEISRGCRMTIGKVAMGFNYKYSGSLQMMSLARCRVVM